MPLTSSHTLDNLEGKKSSYKHPRKEQGIPSVPSAYTNDVLSGKKMLAVLVFSITMQGKNDLGFKTNNLATATLPAIFILLQFILGMTFYIS